MLPKLNCNDARHWPKGKIPPRRVQPKRSCARHGGHLQRIRQGQLIATHEETQVIQRGDPVWRIQVERAVSPKANVYPGRAHRTVAVTGMSKELTRPRAVGNVNRQRCQQGQRLIINIVEVSAQDAGTPCGRTS